MCSLTFFPQKRDIKMLPEVVFIYILGGFMNATMPLMIHFVFPVRK